VLLSTPYDNDLTFLHSTPYLRRYDGQEAVLTGIEAAITKQVGVLHFVSLNFPETPGIYEQAVPISIKAAITKQVGALRFVSLILPETSAINEQAVPTALRPPSQSRLVLCIYIVELS
jgi:hypothetical protein